MPTPERPGTGSDRQRTAPVGREQGTTGKGPATGGGTAWDGSTIRSGRLRRDEAAAEESGVAAQQIIAAEAPIDAPRLLAAGDLARAGSAITVMLRNMLPRATAESGSEGVAEKADLAMEARSAETLERMEAPIAAAMMRGAVDDEQAALARRAAFQGLGGRQ